jgi:non-specific serine/threonine protein kinase
MVGCGRDFHPLRWTPREALQLLHDVPQLETAGVVVRMPAAWRGSRPPRPKVTGTVGTKTPSGLGQDALLDFRMDVTHLTVNRSPPRRFATCLARTDGLALARGRWVEIDRENICKA